MLRALARSLTATAMVAIGCSDVAGPLASNEVVAVRVAPFAAWLQPGDTLRLSALPLDGGGVPLVVPVKAAWRAEPPSVVEVDATGKVTAVRPGDAEVTASVEGVEGSAQIHVLHQPEAFAPFRVITAGDDFTCAADVHGVAACWGLNAHGQLGSGGTSGGAVPVAVAEVAGVTAVTAGTRHACVIDQDGALWCWGWNSVRQVGLDVSEKTVPIPRRVDVPGRFIGLAAGSGHSCALRKDGVAFCWGAGALGQLGGASATPAATGLMATAGPFTAITAGHAHTCALDAEGIAWCWGWNAAGQLGAETPECQAGIPCSPQPVRVRMAVRLRAIAAGSGFTCGIGVDGQAYCWGANASGQLGHAGPPSTVPRAVEGVPTFTHVAAGAEHACGLTASGAVICWGANRLGQLGDGTTDSRSGPVAAGLAPGPATGIAAGGAHTCVLTVDGRVACWGANSDGQLGPFPVVRQGASVMAR